MIKTLHLTNAYHASSGGIRTFYQAMLAAAATHRRQLRLVVPAEQSAVEDVNAFARIHHVRAPRSLFIDRRYRLIMPHRYLLGRSGAVWNILRAEQPDLIEVCDKYSLCYLGGLVRRGWLTRAPRPALVGLTCERMDDNVATFLSHRVAAQRFASWYMRTVYVPQFDGHIAVSRYVAGEVDLGLRPVHVAPMGLDPRQFAHALRTSSARCDLFSPMVADARAAILLYVGRLSTEKNIPLLLDTIDALGTADNRTYHLCVAGDGPLRRWLQVEGERRAPGRVHWLGHIAGRAALARVYANADVFLHPNPREPLGLGPLEAMASGLPLVASASGGVQQFATPENAWLTEPSGGSFAQAVRCVLTCGDLTAGKVARARAAAEAHDWSIVTARYFELYDQVHQQSEPSRHIGS